MNVNTELYDKAADRSAMRRLYENTLNDKVGAIHDDHETQIAKEISTSKKFDRSFKRRLAKRIDTDYGKMDAVTKASFIDLFADQASYTYQNFEAALSKAWRSKNVSRSVAEEFVLNEPLYMNTTLTKGWSSIGTKERVRIESLIRKGIAEKQTMEEMAVRVRKSNIHKISRNQSRTLVITATTSVYNQADHAVYEVNEKALQGWQYVAILDARTTAICSARDGNIYPISNRVMMPPAHFGCRSFTIPVVKAYEDLASLSGVAQVRKRNLAKLGKKERAYYDGLTPLKESYDQWLRRQPEHIQLKHLGNYDKVKLFQEGRLPLSKFTTTEGTPVGVNTLRRMTDDGLINDTQRFALAKEKLDAMQIYAGTPDDFINDLKLTNTLRDYYKLQATELDGTLSLINYRGIMLPSKKASRRAMLSKAPTDKQLKFNPFTNRREDSRFYAPDPYVYRSSLKRVEDSVDLLERDKIFIKDFVENKLDRHLGYNERSVIADNLRVTFGRQRVNKEVWANFKGVSQGQIKFDVMNISDSIETNLRSNSNFMKKLLNDNYIDPVLGVVQFDELSKEFIDVIRSRNKWEDTIALKVAKELRNVFDLKIPIHIRNRMTDEGIQTFYNKFAMRLAVDDTPDFDQLAVMLGKDLYNSANLNGTRMKWYGLGKTLLETNNKFYDLASFGVQKRRMKSRLSGKYFGPYYDTTSFNIHLKDARIKNYSKMNRKIDVGLRMGVVDERNRLIVRKGYKTFFIKDRFGLTDTRIPITSTSSFKDFPEEFIDQNLVDSLNWMATSKFEIDEDYHDAIKKILYFKDDRGKAKFFDELNELKKYLSSRDDSYERFKAMDWLRGKSFSTNVFIDHRARIYERGFIGPQSGEVFRPFLNTAHERNMNPEAWNVFQDQVGAFLGGLNDEFEGRYDSLTQSGRQKIAAYHRPELVRIGNHMLRKKPEDIRAILQSDMVSKIDGEELPKFLRFAIESAKIDNHLGGNYKDINKILSFKTKLALEQDASSSGAQIIALTTKNKQLAELSNVVPTNRKKRLYDEVARDTFNDSRFRKLNLKLGISEKDLRKAAKSKLMVTFLSKRPYAVMRIENWVNCWKLFSKKTISSRAWRGISLKVQRLKYTVQNGL